MALSLLGVSIDSSQVSMAFFFSHLLEEDSFSLRQEMDDAIAENRSFSCECRLKEGVKASGHNSSELTGFEKVEFKNDTSVDSECAEWLLIQGTPIMDSEVTTRIIGHIQKITEQKKQCSGVGKRPQYALSGAEYDTFRSVLERQLSQNCWYQQSFR